MRVYVVSVEGGRQIGLYRSTPQYLGVRVVATDGETRVEWLADNPGPHVGDEFDVQITPTQAGGDPNA